MRARPGPTTPAPFRFRVITALIMGVLPDCATRNRPPTTFVGRQPSLESGQRFETVRETVRKAEPYTVARIKQVCDCEVQNNSQGLAR